MAERKEAQEENEHCLQGVNFFQDDECSKIDYGDDLKTVNILTIPHCTTKYVDELCLHKAVIVFKSHAFQATGAYSIWAGEEIVMWREMWYY